MEVNDEHYALITLQPATDPLIPTVWNIYGIWGRLGRSGRLDKTGNRKSSVPDRNETLYIYR